MSDEHVARYHSKLTALKSHEYMDLHKGMMRPSFGPLLRRPIKAEINGSRSPTPFAISERVQVLKGNDKGSW
jgi:hypothetical protein